MALDGGNASRDNWFDGNPAFTLAVKEQLASAGLTPPAGTTTGYVPTVQADGSVAYAAPAGGGGGGTLATMAAGTAFYVQKNGANWEYPRGTTITARPTSRTDIKMISVSTDGTVPSFAISGWDEAETVPA